jgi:hypothetical protein
MRIGLVIIEIVVAEFMVDWNQREGCSGEGGTQLSSAFVCLEPPRRFNPSARSAGPGNGNVATKRASGSQMIYRD